MDAKNYDLYYNSQYNYIQNKLFVFSLVNNVNDKESSYYYSDWLSAGGIGRHWVLGWLFMSPLNPQINWSHENASIKHLIFSSSDWAAKRAAPIYFYWRGVYLERIPPGSRDSNWCKIGWLRQTASVCHCLIISRPTSGSHIYSRERKKERKKQTKRRVDWLITSPRCRAAVCHCPLWHTNSSLWQRDTARGCSGRHQCILG